MATPAPTAAAIAPSPSSAATPGTAAQSRGQQRRAFWLKHLHRWHWISAALSLMGLLLFSVTGFTLNHAADIEARPVVQTLNLELPAPLLAELVAAAGAESPAIPAAVRAWLRQETGAYLREAQPEWSEAELYLALPQPGGDGWLSIALDSGAIEYEHTDRGWISWANDLHKGRHTGMAWRWFIDIFAGACLLFALTGLCLLWLHARRRAATWPLVGLGLLAPLLLLLLLVH